MTIQLSRADIIEAFKKAMLENGIVPPDFIESDTKQFIRFNPQNGKTAGDNLDAGYVLHTDGKPNGLFQDYRIHDKPVKWIYKDNSEREKRIDFANKLFNNYAKPITDKSKIPYLVEKGIKNFQSIKVNTYKDKTSLVIPYRDIHGNLITVQFIDTTKKENGRYEKRFLKGTAREYQGNYSFFSLGDKPKGKNELISIAEGYSNLDTVFNELQEGYFVSAGGCGNLLKTAKEIRKYYANPIVIFGDNDQQEKAVEAAKAINAYVLFPPKQHNQFNDYVHSNDYNPDYISEKTAYILNLNPSETYGLNDNNKKENLPIQTVSTNNPMTWEKELNKHVEMFNEKHAKVIIGGKSKIMRIRNDKKTKYRELYEFISFQTLVDIYQHTRIKTGEKLHYFRVVDVKKDYASAWIEHPNSRVYTQGIVFTPIPFNSIDDTPEGYFNMWKGFAINPQQKKSFELIEYHLKHVICNSNNELFEYILNWLAFTFQNPDKPARVALVLRGEKGSGKGTLGNFLTNIWGTHGLHISNAQHLIGKFNGHLENCCFLFADEAFYSGDKQHEGVLKALITEPDLIIERKGIDAISQPNYLKILMATNSDFAVPATRDERRYCVCDVSNLHINDKVYFDDLHKDCNDKEVMASFLYAMLNRDISNFHISKIPETDALKEQRLHNLSSIGKWLVDCLECGYFQTKDTTHEWQEQVKSSTLYDSYIYWCDRMKINEYHRETIQKFGRYLNSIGFEKTDSRNGNSIVRKIGTLHNAIQKFESHEKVMIERKH